METEIWPNLIDAGRQAGVPIVLANARLSLKSMRGAQRAAVLLRPAYANLSAVWAQTSIDADRLRAVGAQPVEVLGNLKFDADPDAAALTLGRTWREHADKPVVMLASSREGEEAMFLEAISTHRDANVQWLIVPRHPQRFDAVAQIITQAGWHVSRRSSWSEEQPPQTDNQTVWLGDSLGEMAAYYALAEIALLGGSFAPLGGQNLIEAAACGCPVIMGMHTFNFDQAAQMSQDAGSALRAHDMVDALRQARKVLSESTRHEAMVQAAGHFAASQRGAAARMADALVQLLSASTR
jgi:3-deoxy-D-manno-octulosonic-acid transferase